MASQGFSAFIAARYRRSRRNSRFLSRGSVIAIVGITIGVAVLNITLAVMNGFSAEMMRTFVENMPMITLVTSAPEGFTDLGAVMDSTATDPEVTGVAPLVRREVIITAGRTFGSPRTKGALVWGVDPDLIDEVQPLSKYLLQAPEILAGLRGGVVPRVILGADLANSLYAAIGDTVILTAAKGELKLDHIEAESRRFVVIGFFDTGMYEFDSQFVYVDIRDGRDFFGYGPQGATMVGLKVDDLMRADVVAERVQEKLGYGYYATDWKALNRNLFQWIQYEKVMMILLLGMIILIAGFNIVGILTMMVGERRREIGILLAMGARRGQIMGIFLLNGLWLGAMGILVGTGIGLAAIFALETWGLKLPGDVYFVETVPGLLHWSEVVLVGGVTFLMALVAGLWPSWEASNLKPMEIIRYE